MNYGKRTRNKELTPEFRAKFNAFDRDGNGYLDRNEF